MKRKADAISASHSATTIRSNHKLNDLLGITCFPVKAFTLLWTTHQVNHNNVMTGGSETYHTLVSTPTYFSELSSQLYWNFF